jgi:hypothetical protein
VFISANKSIRPADGYSHGENFVRTLEIAKDSFNKTQLMKPNLDFTVSKTQKW